MYKYTGKKRFRYIVILLTCILFTMLILSSIETITKIRYPVKYQEYVYKYSQVNKLDPYLVFAIIKAESGFDAKATSSKNARGLMQITEQTGAWAAKKTNMKGYAYEKLYDPETNIALGCWYISWLKTQFDSMDLVIAAYNSGNGRVNEWLRDRSLSVDGDRLDKIPYKETETYVKRVTHNYSKYKKLYEKSN